MAETPILMSGPLVWTRLDLRDVTARAHAAMVYTVMDEETGKVVAREPLLASLTAAATRLQRLGELRGSVARLEARAAYEIARGACSVLRRMRAMDESVTWQEARAALDWAHDVTVQFAGGSDAGA